MTNEDAKRAFDKYLESRGLSAEKLDPKEWSNTITYKHSHIEAMFEGWCAALEAQAVDLKDVHILRKECLQYGKMLFSDLQNTHVCRASVYAAVEYLASQGHLRAKPEPSFKHLAEQLVQYLCENHHPHTKIIIDGTGAEIVEGVKSTGTIEKYIKD